MSGNEKLYKNMMYLIILFIVILMFPYIRFVWKRIVLILSLKKKCSENIKVIPTHHLWYLGNRKNENCDFYVETDNEIFAVKLFEVLKHNSILVFKENGTYHKRTRRPIAYSGFSNIDSKSNPVKEYNFKYKFRSEWEIKTPKNILLLNPVCKEIVYQKKNGLETILGSGDVINGMYIYALSRFLGEMEKNDAAEDF